MTVRMIAPAAPTLESAGAFRPNRRLSSLARRVTHSASALLAADRRMLLGVLSEGDRISLGWWNPQFELVARLDASRSDFCPVGTEEGAVQRSSAVLLDWLIGRWPPGAAPARFGIVTDGVGVAFAPERPDPFPPGWFADIASGRYVLREIRPLSPTGSAALLTYQDQGIVLH